MNADNPNRLHPAPGNFDRVRDGLGHESGQSPALDAFERGHFAARQVLNFALALFVEGKGNARVR